MSTAALKKEESVTSTCPSCHKEVAATAKFCNFCGTKMVSAKVETPQLEEVSKKDQRELFLSVVGDIKKKDVFSIDDQKRLIAEFFQLPNPKNPDVKKALVDLMATEHKYLLSFVLEKLFQIAYEKEYSELLLKFIKADPDKNIETLLAAEIPLTEVIAKEIIAFCQKDEREFKSWRMVKLKQLMQLNKITLEF